MKKLTLLTLALSAVFVFSLLFLPQAAHASTLFLDEFNGSGELHSYNNLYQIDHFDNPTGTMNVVTDHVETASIDPGYVYTGIASTNVCASIDFNWTSGGNWTAILLNGNPNNSGDSPIQFYIERPGQWILIGGIIGANGSSYPTGTVSFDANQTHTVK